MLYIHNLMIKSHNLMSIFQNLMRGRLICDLQFVISLFISPEWVEYSGIGGN
jgi:hypothetical protein